MWIEAEINALFCKDIFLFIDYFIFILLQALGIRVG